MNQIAITNVHFKIFSDESVKKLVSEYQQLNVKTREKIKKPDSTPTITRSLANSDSPKRTKRSLSNPPRRTTSKRLKSESTNLSSGKPENIHIRKFSGSHYGRTILTPSNSPPPR